LWCVGKDNKQEATINKQMKFSIITPSFNQAQYLHDTARSVLNQAGPFDLEWIVIDGGSTDGSVDYLKGLKHDVRVRWISEKDNGQSDAINKGFAMATGELMAWLNSDDVYTSLALSHVWQAFHKKPDAQWLVGRYQIVNDAGSPIRPGIVRYKEKQLRHFSYRRLLVENFIPQPATFWRKSLLDQVGPLDTSLHFTMDYDLWLRMAKVAPPLVLNEVVANFRVHASSKTGIINRRQFDEGYEVARRHADGFSGVLLRHRMSVEKIVLAYRLLKLLGR
jgi:glycosyltransferase involved in cell wall biosynthesis